MTARIIVGMSIAAWGLFSGSMHALGQEANPQNEAAPKINEDGADEWKLLSKATLGGNCPVTYQEHHVAMRGSPEWISKYQGRIYRLASKEFKSKFDADPDRYVPQFGGWCATALGGSYGNKILSDPQVFDVYKNKLYLFSSERAKRAYVKYPQSFIAKANKIFKQPAYDGYDLVALHDRKRDLLGSQVVVQLYNGQYFQFLGSKERDRFNENPEKYIPMFDGYCAEGVTRGKRYPGSIGEFLVLDGQTYLFFDAKARVVFATDRESMIKKANETWSRMEDKGR